jgi:septal ring factor EnvC (AmiA/AmiB activator)
MSEFMEAHVSEKATAYKVTSGVLGLLALLGWGLFGYSLISPGNQEDALREQTSRLQSDLDELNAEHGRVTTEYSQLRQSAGDLQNVQRQLASVQEQVKGLEQTRSQLNDWIAQAQARLASSLDPSDDERATRTGTTPPVSRPVRLEAAQEALKKLGYGPLVSDGRMGRKTRQAIEAFERAQGLTVTGELGATTVQALQSTSGISIQ